MLRKILLVLLAILVIIQFFRPARNKTEAAQPHFIGTVHTVPGNVHVILKKACFDCHSNNTYYPWYSNIQPFGWWLATHVNDGKKELNFDEYTNKRLRFQYHKMEEVEEVINDAGMPLESYTWMHRDAELTASEKNTLVNWSLAVRKSMEAIHPMDSLISKN